MLALCIESLQTQMHHVEQANTTAMSYQRKVVQNAESQAPKSATASASPPEQCQGAKSNSTWFIHWFMRVAGIDTHVVVSNFIVALTSPPDARYSPLTKPAKGPASPTSFDTVRALVLPIATDAVATKVTHSISFSLYKSQSGVWSQL